MLRLFLAILSGEKRAWIGKAASVADRHRLQNIAVVVDFKGDPVRDSRISTPTALDVIEFALVMEVNLLARMGEEYRVAIRSAPLQGADGEVALRHRIGPVRLLGLVETVDLLPQH